MKDTYARALALGVVGGGIPTLLGIPLLNGSVASAEFLKFSLICTPLWILVSTVMGVRGFDGAVGPRLGRIYLISLGACVPVPAIIFATLDWRYQGWGVFDVKNLPFLLLLLTVWALVVGTISIFLALTYRAIARR